MTVGWFDGTLVLKYDSAMRIIPTIIRSMLAAESHSDYLYLEEEGDSYQDGKDFYDLNTLFRGVQHQPVQQIAVNKLDWVINSGDRIDQERVNRADLTAPLLVTLKNGKEQVVDGFHRLNKAKQTGIKYLPFRRVSSELMAQALLKRRS